LPLIYSSATDDALRAIIANKGIPTHPLDTETIDIDAERGGTSVRE
jgi:hypothetical protein